MPTFFAMAVFSKRRYSWKGGARSRVYSSVKSAPGCWCSMILSGFFGDSDVRIFVTLVRLGFDSPAYHLKIFSRGKNSILVIKKKRMSIKMDHSRLNTVTARATSSGIICESSTSKVVSRTPIPLGSNGVIVPATPARLTAAIIKKRSTTVRDGQTASTT